MKKLVPLLILGIAFGVIEGSVAIYLRPILSSGKADFAIRVIQPEILTDIQRTVIKTEIDREIATIVLIAAAAAVSAASIMHWFSYFVFTFAVWDIFYYIWMSFRIGWPKSLFDWDILFLIPRMWFAPVIVPVIISCFGIVFSVIALRGLDISKKLDVRFYHLVPVSMALILWLVSFLNKSVKGMTAFPESYSWVLFVLGVICALFGGVVMYWDYVFRPKRWMFKR